MNDKSDYGTCESCQFYPRLMAAGFCLNCTKVLLTDGTYLRSGYAPKTPMTISSMPKMAMGEGDRGETNGSK